MNSSFFLSPTWRNVVVFTLSFLFMFSLFLMGFYNDDLNLIFANTRGLEPAQIESIMVQRENIQNELAEKNFVIAILLLMYLSMGVVNAVRKMLINAPVSNAVKVFLVWPFNW